MLTFLGLVAVASGVMLLLALTGHLVIPNPNDKTDARSESGWFSKAIERNQDAHIPIRFIAFRDSSGAEGAAGFAVADVTPEDLYTESVMGELNARLANSDPAE